MSMGRNRFNPVENQYRDLSFDLQELQNRNKNFSITNFGEVPKANYQVTNLCSPDNGPILPDCTINGDQLGAKIRRQVNQGIAQTWADVGPGVVNLNNIIDNAARARRHGKGGSQYTPPAAPPLHGSYQDTSALDIGKNDMPPSAVQNYDTPQFPASQAEAASPQEVQSGGVPNRGVEEGNAQTGPDTSDNMEGADRLDKTQIKTGDPTDLTIKSDPTISPKTIDAVLAAHNSPVEGYGQEIFERCVQAGIDPAIAVAIFGCESTFGTDGIAVSNNSWGNIRSTDGSGGFRNYSSFMDGLQDWLNLMNNLYVASPEKGGFGFTTMDDALSKYAPPSENDTQGYASKVGTLVSEWRSEEAALPHDDSKLKDVVDKARDGIDTIRDISRSALEKMFFTQFEHPQWNSYSGAPPSSSNCGPASLAMALRVLGVEPGGGVQLDGNPNLLVTRVRSLMTTDADESNGTWLYQVGDAAAKLGLSVDSVGSIDTIDDALDAGRPVVLSGNPIAYNQGMTGDEYATHDGVVFTGGHIISVVGLNDDGTYEVMDPAYKKGILTLSRDQLAGYMDSPGLAIGKPSNL